MSLYSQYLEEARSALGIHIIETEYGYVTYKLFENESECYIEDIYVIPEKRKSGYASFLADQVADIAKSKGFKYLSGTVIPSYAGSTTSLKVLFGYGFRLLRSEVNKIWLIKEL